GMAYQRMVLACLLVFLVLEKTTAQCVPTQYTLYVENPECAFCVAVNTTICAGYCMTRPTSPPTATPGGPQGIQQGCVYKLTKSMRLPGCAPQVNPFYTYPVALTCKCGKCNTDFSDCTQEPTLASHCNKPLLDFHLDLHQSNFIPQ
uniref:Thyrotropin subunit beta n=1 Tax=Erpetoichthys calabaricus TaxID=27687 RepID=A0A8C4X7F6_ERPCA